MQKKMKIIIVVIFSIALILIGIGIVFQLMDKEQQPSSMEKLPISLSEQDRAKEILKKDYPDIEFKFIQLTKDGAYQFTPSKNESNYTKMLYTVNLKTKKYTISSSTQGGEQEQTKK